ncbi:site-2 protease family protein [Candidatus Woesearchaeota archaeon]|nr:site-2 protease family protein [Candidatus Woesearchaeota archaeon]
MDIQIIAAIAFVLFLIIFLFIKRKNIQIQKILFPIFYLILYRSNFGIKFMNRFAQKYRQIIKFFGYCCIGLSFLGLIFISVNIILMIWQLIAAPAVQQPGVALVLPFTHVPGIGYLSFFQWIIAIFILAVVHEFAHGIVARAHNMQIKSSGFAFFSLIAPIIPAAFVEPDEKRLMKSPDFKQYSVFAAGPIVNILLALLILLALPYVANPAKLAPFEATITEPIGFSFFLTNETLPAAQAGLKDNMIINSFNNKPITDATSFLETMYYCIKPGDTIIVGTENKTYTITTVPADDIDRGIIGVTNFKNERRVKPEYKSIKPVFYWFKDLFKWLFLLNFFIGLFNLLPLGIVDGGRILNTLLQSTMKDKEKAKKVWGFISLFFILLLILGLITTYLGNPFAFLK